MPKKHNAGGCGCCAVCKCNGVAWGTLYVEIDSVAMNASPVLPECLTPRFGQTFDETWFNGVTFVFNLDWDYYGFSVNNPNDFDTGNAEQCASQGGTWVCIYYLAPLGGFNSVISLSMNVSCYVVAGKFRVVVGLTEYNTVTGGSAIEISSQNVVYEYDSECPTGSYTEIDRTLGSPQNNGAFDFRNFNAALTWA